MNQDENIPTPSSKTYELLAINELIRNTTDLASLEKLYDKHGKYNHPQVCHDFGRMFIIKGDKIKAKEALFRGATYGIQYPTNLYDNPYIDPIGQCLTDLVTQYPIFNVKIAIKATSLAYIYLSRCIELCPRAAFDSYRTRALLFQNHKMNMLPHSIISEYMGLSVLIDPFIICDHYFSSQASYSPFKVSGIESAKKAHNWLEDISVNGKDADDYSLSEIAELGEKRHFALFKSIELRYKQKEFNITIENLKELNK